MKTLEDFFNERFDSVEDELWEYWDVQKGKDGSHYINIPMPTLEEVRELIENCIQDYCFDEDEVEEYESMENYFGERKKELDAYFEMRFETTKKLYQNIVENRAKYEEAE